MLQGPGGSTRTDDGRRTAVVDPAHGYAELGTVTCAHGGLSVTTAVACVKADPHTCVVGALRLASEAVPLTPVMSICEDVGNPGCF